MYASAPFSLETLGTLRLSGPSGELLAGRRKELALLVYLTRQSPRSVSREKLAALLWGERDETKARQSLRHALHQLRRALGESIDVSNGSIRVLPGNVELDALRFEEGMAAGHLADALALWQGDFLSGLDDLGHEEFRSWLERERESLRRTLRSGFEGSVTIAAEQKQLKDAARWARQWVDSFPLDEAANTRLIESLVATGEAGQARAAHEAFRSTLRAELDVSPSAEFLRLGEEIQRALRHAQERSSCSAALFSPELIGRDSLLASLTQLWSGARREPVVALIEGEEGLGKSRLCREFAQRIRSTGKNHLVLEIHAVPGDGRTQGTTIRRVIAALAETSAIEDAPNRSLVELSRLAPELRRRFPQLASPAEDTGQAESALRTAFRAIASETPTLLIVDDFACADSPSQELLLSLASALPAGMLLVLTIRPDQIEGTKLLSELGRLPSARRMKLSALTVQEVALLVDSMLQLPSDDRDNLAARITAESGGNPFYALELISALADAGMLAHKSRGTWSLTRGFDSQAMPLPPSLRTAIKLRLEHLSEPARKVLDVAAITPGPIGPTSPDLAAAISHEEIQPAIDELLSRRLMRISGSSGPGYEFAHDLIRRVAAEKATRTPARERPRLEAPSPTSVRPSRARLVQTVVGFAIAGTLVFLVAPSTKVAAPTAASGDDLRIVVAAFANETGDAKFDRLGRITADFLTRGIAQTGLISVLPPVLAVSAPGTPGASMLPDDFPRLSPDIAPSMIISGAMYRTGDSIRFDAQITDARARRVFRVIDPVLASAAEPMIGIELLRQKLLATLALSLDVRLTSSVRDQRHVPSYESYRAFAEALDDLYARRGDAPSKFLRSYALDSAFTLPLLYASMAYHGQGNFPVADSLVKGLQPRRNELPPYDRYVLDYQLATLRNDRSEAYAAARAAAAIAPGSYAAVVLAPGAAIQLNYPAEAVRLLSQIDRERSAAKGLPVYWNLLAHSYHLLGRYEDQLTVARELRRRIPEDTRALYYEARALAALGRLSELEAVLSESLSLPSVAGYGPPGLGAHRFAAEELRAHGNAAHATEILERGVRFYQSAPAEVLAIARFQHEIAYVLYQLGRLPEARNTYERLVRTKALKGGELLSITYYLAFIASKQKDTARVHELERYIRENPEPYTDGMVAFMQARLASLRGEKELAMRLLQQSAADGLGFSHTNHHLFEFENMRGYPPYERWLAPKG